MRISSIAKQKFDDLRWKISFDGPMNRSKTSFPSNVIYIRTSHEKLLHSIGVFSKKIKDKDSSALIIFEVNIFCSETQVHTNIITFLQSRVKDWWMTIRVFCICVSSPITKEFNCPQLLLPNCYEKCTIVNIFSILFKNLRPFVK